jgi:alkyl hydroperoxide reductase subunit AhpC
MALRIGDEAPDFTADSTAGRLDFHRYIDGHWAILFSHPKDFTPVCTTELGAVARLAPEFARRDCRLVGLSVDSVDDHRRWARDIEQTQGTAPAFPLIGDTDLAVAKLYDMIHPLASGTAKDRTAADNSTVRCVFVIGPDRRIKATFTYPMSTGRNFEEVLRLLDSVRLTACHKVATPADWQYGDDVIIVPAVGDAEARERFPGGWKAPKPYLRIVAQPR